MSRVQPEEKLPDDILGAAPAFIKNQQSTKREKNGDDYD
jgi:hypothetical protein